MNANKRESLRNSIRVYLRPFAVNFPSDFETIQLRAIRVFRGQDSLHPSEAGPHRLGLASDRPLGQVFRRGYFRLLRSSGNRE